MMPAYALFAAPALLAMLTIFCLWRAGNGHRADDQNQDPSQD